MRVMIVSDTHRKHENLEAALTQAGHIDLLIHLGDAEGCEDYIEALASCPVEIVAGNSDFFSPLDSEREITIGKYKVLITHGHYYNVNASIENIKKEARSRGFDMVMFGHTHRPVIDRNGRIAAINPGSLSYPRQEGKQPSYIMMETDGEGMAEFELFYL